MPFAGECKQFMQVYLDCLRKNGSNSTPCRHLNKDYLECRMARCAPAFPLPVHSWLGQADV